MSSVLLTCTTSQIAKCDLSTCVSCWPNAISKIVNHNPAAKTGHKILYLYCQECNQLTWSYPVEKRSPSAALVSEPAAQLHQWCRHASLAELPALLPSPCLSVRCASVRCWACCACQCGSADCCGMGDRIEVLHHRLC